MGRSLGEEPSGRPFFWYFTDSSAWAQHPEKADGLGVFQAGYWWAGGLGILSAAITATYVLRMLSRAYFGPLNERWAGLKEMRLGEQFAAVLLIAMILFMGLWPAPFIDLISDTVEMIPGITG